MTNTTELQLVLKRDDTLLRVIESSGSLAIVPPLTKHMPFLRVRYIQSICTPVHIPVLAAKAST